MSARTGFWRTQQVRDFAYVVKDVGHLFFTIVLFQYFTTKNQNTSH